MLNTVTGLQRRNAEQQVTHILRTLAQETDVFQMMSKTTRNFEKNVAHCATSNDEKARYNTNAIHEGINKRASW